MIYNDILETVGRTPLVKIGYLSERGRSVYGKLEGLNPSGSVKDRAAAQILRDALNNRRITENTVIIEASAGNFAVSVAMCSAAMGFDGKIVMPENVNPQRIANVRAYGADVVLTPKVEGLSGAVKKAESLKEEIGDAFIMGQFSNKSATDAHFAGTAKEIFMDLPSVKWIVAGLGSGATVVGLTRYIVAKRLDCNVCVVMPEGNEILEGGEAAAHKIQGIGPENLPKIASGVKFDKIVYVSDDEAVSAARKVAAEEGIFVGISSGAALAAAEKLMKEEKGDVVVILPDMGQKYLNSSLCDYE